MEKCESEKPNSDNQSSRGNPSQRSVFTETREFNPKIINLSKRIFSDNEIILLKRGLKFTPTPNEDKIQLGADIEDFYRRLRLNYIFSEDEKKNENK